MTHQHTPRAIPSPELLTADDVKAVLFTEKFPTFFRSGKRQGWYNGVEVDEFLDQVADTLEHLEDIIDQLQNATAARLHDATVPALPQPHPTAVHKDNAVASPTPADRNNHVSHNR